LQCIFAVLRFDFDSEKLEEGVLPEIEVLERMISYFGPLLLGLLEHINHDKWCIALFQLNRSFTKDNPAQLFSLWADQSFPYQAGSRHQQLGYDTDGKGFESER
jgi:hypothetical protein